MPGQKTGQNEHSRWLDRELKKRMRITGILSVIICVDALGIGMVLASFYKYGLYGIADVMLLFSTAALMIYLFRELVATLVQTNWLWTQIRDIHKQKTGSPK